MTIDNPFESPSADDSTSQATASTAAEEQFPLTDEMLSLLQGARPWQTFMGVILALVSALMFFAGPCVGLSAVAEENPGAFVAVFLYPLFSLLYAVPAYFLIRGSTALSNVKRHPDITVGYVEEALRYQRSFWRFTGIATLVVISLYVFIIVFAVVVLIMVGVLAGAGIAS